MSVARTSTIQHVLLPPTGFELPHLLLLLLLRRCVCPIPFPRERANAMGVAISKLDRWLHVISTKRKARLEAGGTPLAPDKGGDSLGAPGDSPDVAAAFGAELVVSPARGGEGEGARGKSSGSRKPRTPGSAQRVRAVHSALQETTEAIQTSVCARSRIKEIDPLLLVPSCSATSLLLMVCTNVAYRPSPWPLMDPATPHHLCPRQRPLQGRQRTGTAPLLPSS